MTKETGGPFPERKAPLADKAKGTYCVDVDNFVGPLGLLLELIEKNNLGINRIALSQVADRYLTFIEKREIDLEEMADFLEIASRLVLIKSLTLLPLPEGTEEEKRALELESRLKIYLKFRLASLKLFKRYLNACSFSRECSSNLFLSQGETRKIEKKMLKEALGKLLNGLPDSCILKKEKVKAKTEIKDLMLYLERKLRKVREASFLTISGKMDRREVVLAFLALLELARKSGTILHQKGFLKDILISRT